MGKISIATKLSIAILIIVGTLGTVASVFVWSSTNSDLLEAEKSNLLSILRNTSESIYNRIDASHTITHHLGSMEKTYNVYKSGQTDQILSHLNSFNINNQFLSIYFVSQDGIVDYSTDPNFVGLDVNHREYYQNAFKDLHTVTTAIGHRSNELGFYISHGLKDPNTGSISAVLAAKLDPQVITTTLDRSKISNHGTLHIIDRFGTIVHSTNKDSFLTAIDTFTAIELQEIENLRLYPTTPSSKNLQFLKSALSKYQSPIIIEDPNNPNIIYGLMKIGSHDLYAILEENTQNINTLSTNAAYRVAILVGLAAALAIVLISIIMRSFLKPLQEINTATSEITKGNLNVSITPPNTKDEFRSIALNINEMIKAIKTSQENLESKIEKRTKELANKVADLEKFNKFITKREVKMANLKQENKELKDKLNLLEEKS